MLSSAVEYGSTTLKAGDKVAHERFGMGTVISVEGSGNGAKAQIDFEKGVGIKNYCLNLQSSARLSDLSKKAETLRLAASPRASLSSAPSLL